MYFHRNCLYGETWLPQRCSALKILIERILLILTVSSIPRSFFSPPLTFSWLILSCSRSSDWTLRSSTSSRKCCLCLDDSSSSSLRHASSSRAETPFSSYSRHMYLFNTAVLSQKVKFLVLRRKQNSNKYSVPLIDHYEGSTIIECSPFTNGLLEPLR